MIDSHTHLFLCEGEEDALVAAAEAAGVRRMLNVGLGAETNPVALAAAERHEGVFATAGCHPTSAGEFDDELAAEIWKLAEHERVRAIGETGLDYYRETASREAQQVARSSPRSRSPTDFGLPIVIHARDPDGETGAVDDVFSILDQHPTEIPVILHCFLAPWRVQDAIERGWYCSFSGIVTYPEVRRAARGRGGRCPTSCSWSRPTLPTWRRSRCGESRTSRPTSSPRPRRWPQRGARPTRSWSGVVEANARTLFGW